MGIEFGVLGAVRVCRNGRELPVGGRRQRVVLAMLLAGANRAVSVDGLVDAVWAADPPSTAREQIQTAVWRLRAVLGPGLIERTAAGYRITVEPDRYDARLFERRVREAAADPDPGRRSGALRVALGGWRGDTAYAGLGEVEPLRSEAARLGDLRLQTVADRVAADIDAGRAQQVVAETVVLAAEHPLRERFTELHMRALHRTGRRAEALAAYRTARRRLVRDCGIEPGARLRRLHQELLTADEPEPVSPPGPAPPAQLPATVGDFVGREDRMRELDELIFAPGPAPVIVLAGPPGVGKTALAVEWAHRRRRRFPDGQLFLTLHGYDGTRPAEAPAVLRQALRALGVPAGQLPAETDAAAALYRTRLADRAVLVVLDDVVSAGQVMPLLPATSGSAAIVISRDRLVGLIGRTDARLLNLDVLAAEESFALLRRIVGGARTATEPEAAGELADRCGHLPLALRIAGAHLVAAPRDPLADHVTRLDTDVFGALRLGEGESGGVLAAFAQSYRRLPESSRRVFRLLGVLPGADASTPAVAALAEAEVRAAEADLRCLANANLISQVGRGRYGFHDLLRSYARRLAAEDPEAQAALERLLSWYVRCTYAATDVLYPYWVRLPLPSLPPVRAVPAFDRQSAIAWLEGELANVVAAADHAAAHPPHHPAWLLATAIPLRFWTSGWVAEWWSVGVAADRAVRAAGDLASRAAVLRARGMAGVVQGQVAEGSALLVTAAEEARQAGWRDGEAAIRLQLGSVEMDHGSSGLAAAHVEAAIRLAADIGLEPVLALARSFRGGLAARRGDLAEAVPELTAALALSRRLRIDAYAAIALTVLVDVLTRCGRAPEAIAHAAEALTAYRDQRDRFGEANILCLTAAAERAAGDLDAAERHAHDALRLAITLRHEVNQAAAFHQLGMIRCGQRRYRPAVALHRRALAVARQAHDRWTVVEALLALASAHRGCDQTDQARAAAAEARALAGEHGYRLQERAAVDLLAGMSS
ncbi:BTAD domain-containing putative transcriptional regulator [Amycolatopsis sp. WGS_07]|uniref:AfsR/SARP family transcriptional regulator n=1 Tax=Amycolatopsis sp. WGS_07 TaxID=3076764 RepID=UPI003872E284